MLHLTLTCIHSSLPPPLSLPLSPLLGKRPTLRLMPTAALDKGDMKNIVIDVTETKGTVYLHVLNKVIFHLPFVQNKLMVWFSLLAILNNNLKQIIYVHNLYNLCNTLY